VKDRWRAAAEAFSPELVAVPPAVSELEPPSGQPQLDDALQSQDD
jgi:hypothetical protein